jgi:murein L,D-transpeptidase YcbB/YkuD
LRSQAIAVVLALNLALALALSAATPAKKTKPVGTKKTATKASAANASKAKGIAAGRNTAGKKAAVGKKSTATKKTSATTSRFRRSSQREPAPERYQEIQQSLAAKGYYSGPVNGAWGPDSVAALKRFQRDQNIGDDGKLGSLSLMALGLGPKRGAGATEKPEAPTTPAAAGPLP